MEGVALAAAAAAVEDAELAATREAGATLETTENRSTTVTGRIGVVLVDARCPALGLYGGGQLPGAEVRVVLRPVAAVEVPPDPVEGSHVPPRCIRPTAAALTRLPVGITANRISRGDPIPNSRIQTPAWTDLRHRCKKSWKR